MNINLIKQKLSQLTKSTIKCNERLKYHTSIRIGGEAVFFIEPLNVEELINIIKFSRENNIEFFILGNGTNVLFSDKRFDAIVLKLTHLNRIEINDEEIIAEAGVSLPKLLNETVKHNLSGLEFTYGIPGSLGGAVVTNCGIKEKSISDVVKEVEILDDNQKIKVLSKADINFTYRRSCFINNNYVILKVKLKLNRADREKIEEKIIYLKERRKLTQPISLPSCGCIFINPQNNAAGELIEKANCKGLSSGDAYVSRKHANFIINRGNAKAEDVVRLMNIIKERVYKKFNVELKPEVILVGKF